MSYGLQCGPDLNSQAPTFDSSLVYTLFYYDEFDLYGATGNRIYPELAGRTINAFLQITSGPVGLSPLDQFKNVAVDYAPGYPRIQWSDAPGSGRTYSYHMQVFIIGDL